VVAPLENVTIVEVDSYMAAPSAAALLADLGATVIKVEPPGGDPARNLGRKVRLGDDADPNRAAYDFQFDVDNRGKQSVVVDLTTEQGQQVVHRLCETADVFMNNMLIHRQERYGLDPSTLLGVNPRLVHATLTGYGTQGPEAWRPGYDVTAFFARSGLYDAMREGEDGEIPMARTAQGDHTTGLALMGAILAALRLAEKTGEGQVVETSLYETAIWTQGCDYAVTAVDKRRLRQLTRQTQVMPTANRYPCGDGKWIVINSLNGSDWKTFCEVIGREDWLDDDRLQDLRGRFRHMAELVPAIDDALSARGRDQWGELLDAAGLIWSPVLGLHEVVEDPQAQALGLFPTLEHQTIGEYPTVAPPFRFHTADVRPRPPAPSAGANTVEILSAAGYDDAQIDQLAQSGHISTHEA